MNLLVGVLGNNYTKYYSKGDALFHRARAGMILKLQASPSRLVLLWAVPALRRLMSDMRQYPMGCGAVLLLKGLFYLLLLPFLAIVFLLRLLFHLQLSGLKYRLAVALGFGGPNCDVSMAASRIWVLVPEQRGELETQSPKSQPEPLNRLWEMEKWMVKVEDRVEGRLQGVEKQLQGVRDEMQGIQTLDVSLKPGYCFCHVFGTY